MEEPWSLAGCKCGRNLESGYDRDRLEKWMDEEITWEESGVFGGTWKRGKPQRGAKKSEDISWRSIRLQHLCM